MGGTLASLLLNTFPFSRSGNIRASLERCGELADEGWSILIFPEGTRSPDGRLLPFKSGIGLLARGLHVPVIPLAVEGGAAVLPKGAAWPRRGSVSIRVGRPIAEIPDVATDEIALRLEHAVAGLMKGTQEHGT
jgi:long-chain acyl-CoA synthetase